MEKALKGVPVGEVAYAILVDIHSRVGDYQGALSVMEEMAAEGGLVPPLTAYTSLLAGCYRVVNSGMASQAAKAADGSASDQAPPTKRLPPCRSGTSSRRASAASSTCASRASTACCSP